MPPPASHSPLTPLSALLHAGSVWGERPAVRWDDWSITYRELLDRVARVAGGLEASGIEPGDRVAALLPNVPELLEMHFAAPAARAVFVPINVRVSGPELAYILDHCGARLLVTHPSLADVVATAIASLPDPPQVIVTRADADAASEYEERLANAAPLDVRPPDDETALLSDQLHERHHRAAKGRHVHPPRSLSAHARCHRGGTARHPHRVSVDAADVPLQRLGVHVGRDCDGR